MKKDFLDLTKEKWEGRATDFNGGKPVTIEFDSSVSDGIAVRIIDFSDAHHDADPDVVSFVLAGLRKEFGGAVNLSPHHRDRGSAPRAPVSPLIVASEDLEAGQVAHVLNRSLA